MSPEQSPSTMQAWKSSWSTGVDYLYHFVAGERQPSIAASDLRNSAGPQQAERSYQPRRVEKGSDKKESSSFKPDFESTKHPGNRSTKYPVYEWISLTFGVFAILILLWSLAREWLATTQPQLRRYPDLLTAGVEELVAGLESGSFTSVDLTKAYILRIQEVNPILKAVLEINPDALSIAAVLDVERASGAIRSRLHGIPILLKDNIATDDLMNNTAGSTCLLGATVPRDAGVASKLRKAGAILLGKTNMSQWANYRSSNGSSGWSAVGGQALGAYIPNQDPSGSSSGSGIASSLGLATASLGTETQGSILYPASYNNLVGIKPTLGLTSRSLVIPISEHQDVVGPMARTVSDAAFVLSLIAGKDEKDNYTFAQPWDTPPDYVRALNFSSLKGARIGIPRNTIIQNNTRQPVLDAFEEAIRILEDAGATIVENTNYSDFENPSEDVDYEDILIQADFVNNLAGYFSELTTNPNNITGLADMLKYTHNTKIEEYPARDTAPWEEALAVGSNTSAAQVWDAFQHTTYFGGKGGITGALETYDLDALIVPTVFATREAAYAGLPVITVPMGSYPPDCAIEKSRFWGLVDTGPNVPIGLSFLGAKWSEELLIGFAFAFEQRTHIRSKVDPYILPKTQLGDVTEKAGFLKRLW